MKGYLFVTLLLAFVVKSLLHMGKSQGSMPRPASFWTSGERQGYQKQAAEMYLKTFRRVSEYSVHGSKNGLL